MIEELDQINNQTQTKLDQSNQFINRQSSPFKALFLKNISLQKKSVFTNICQIITPLICIMFTLIVQEIVNDKVVTKIGSIPYPQPFNIPGLLNLIPQFNLTCNQFYFYQASLLHKTQARKIINKTLSNYCGDIKKATPYFNQVENVNKQVFHALQDSDKLRFVRGQDLNTTIPDGIIKFNKVSQKQLNLVLAINDLRIPEYHRSNGITKLSLNLKNQTNLINSYLRVTQGELSLMDLVFKAYLNTYRPNQILLSSFMYMPFSGEDKTLLMRIVNVIGAGLYPLGLSLLLPIFLYAIVAQRQEKLLQMMKLNGLSMVYYWMVVFLFNLLLSSITFSTFYIFGTYVLKLSYFTETSSVLMIVILFGWALSQIGLANFLQVFINKAKTATIVGYVVSIFTSLTGQALTTAIYPVPFIMPLYLKIYPVFSLNRVFYLMSFSCSNGSCYKSIYHIDDEMKTCIIILYGGFFLFLFSIYLNQIVQQEFGVKKDTFFIIRPIIRFINQFRGQSYQQYNSQIDEGQTVEIQMNVLEDDSVNKERHKIMTATNYSRLPLVIKNIQKKYQISNGNIDYVAVKSISFSLKQKQIFGLLGPNGAGKTSLISVITGIYPPTKGNAYINGLSIRSQMDNIRMQIGFCPQFDLLWNQLTCQQHLYFYARLKGVPSQKIYNKVVEALNEVDLLKFKDYSSEKLSGGMKRRLSIAIALVGNPSIIFLDQPSSGLDPQHRRDLWNILIKCRQKRSILLTTHSMEEADVLCNRIGIITQGSLRCIGTQTQLKVKYGNGYNLSINLKKCQQEETLEQNIKKLNAFIKKEIKITNIIKFNQNIVYKLKKQDNQLNHIFKILNNNKISLSIQDWSITQPSLYDVFISVVSQEEMQ